MEHDNERLVNRHLAAENRHEMEGTLATLHAESVFEDVALGIQYQGREGARNYYQLWWAAFDLEIKGIQRFWTEDGSMITEARYTGRHVGDFHGIKPTQRNIDFRLLVIVSFRDGLMSGERFYYDARTLLRQLDVTSLPGFP